MKIHYIQHVPFEGLGLIEKWVNENNHELSHSFMFEGVNFPNIEDIDALIVMGGPMGVYDEDKIDWLAPEKAFMKAFIESNKPVFGVCLGAQLIASVLGANVAPNINKEIGYFPIQVFDNAPEVFKELNNKMVLHWHGDRFEIPNGALHIAKSEGCDNQGFIYNNKVIGFQFHIEIEKPALEALVIECANELVDAPYIQKGDEMLKSAKTIDNHRALFKILDFWINL